MAEHKLEFDGGVALAVVGRVMLVVWRGTPTTERMRMLTRMTEHMLQKHAAGFYQIQIIEADSSPPDSEQRKESARLLERMRGAARGIAFVIEGDGARSAIVRTILRGMSLISRGGVPKYFFARPQEAFDWLGPVAELSDLQLREVIRTVDTMRRSMSQSQHPIDVVASA